MYYENVGQNYGPIMLQPDTTSQALLYIFSKAFIPDYARRPMLYTFNGGFRHQLNERLSSVGTLGGWNKSKAFFNNSPDTANILLPTTSASPVNMSVFSELWTFVLILTNVRNSPAFTGIPSITSKEIFSGYFLDDPISNVLVSMGRSDPVNPEAILVTTHHTTIHLNDNAISPFTVMSDSDMIPQQTAANIQQDGAAIASLRPDKLAQGITIQGPFDTSIQTSPVPLNQAANTFEEVDTQYTLPNTHIAKVVNGLANSIANTSFVNTIGTGDAMSDLTANLASHLQPGYAAVISPDANKQRLRPDVTFKISDIELAYPNFVCNICQQPVGQQVDLVDPMAPTVTNQMSSMISNCLPVLLIEHGFAELSMRYCSYDKNPDGFTRGSYCISSASMLCNVSPEIYDAKVRTLVTSIIDDLFGVILANVGEFNVQFSCNIGGATLVDLILLDYASQNQNGFALVNNRMGGLNSPMIGSYEVSAANQQQLSSVIQDCVNTAMAGSTPTYDVY